MSGKRRLLGESSKFAVVGIVSTFVSIVVFNLLVHGYWFIDEAPLRHHAITAYVIASLAGMVVSYRGSRSWAFRDREPRHPDGGRTAFVAINLVTMLLPITCLWISRNAFGLTDPISDNVSANVVGLFLGFVSRFYLFRRFVFSDRAREEVPEFFRRAEGYLSIGVSGRTSPGADPEEPRRTRSE